MALRICFVTPEYALCPPFGGIATYTRDAAQWLAAHGHDVHVIVVARRDDRKTLDDGGVQLHQVSPVRIRPRRLLTYASRIPGLGVLREAYCGWDLLENSVGAWRVVRGLHSASPFDVIEVADSYGLGSWGLMGASRWPPILVRSHGYLDLSLQHANWCGARFQLALERLSVRRADFVLAVSVERVEHYQSVFGVEPSRIGSLPHGVDYSAWNQPSSRASRDKGCVSILYLGRIELRKGCDTLLDALRMVHDVEPRARVVFLGNVARDMEARHDGFMQEAASWAEHVHAVPQDEVRHYLHQADMIVLPSRFETLPRVLIEALAVGTPQVATPVNGIPEIVDDGLTGLLVPVDDARALSDAILELSASPWLRDRMSQESRRRARRLFDINDVMARQVAVYRALVEGRSPLCGLVSDR